VKLANLHEVFIDKARRPMSFGKLPIEPLENGAAIIPVDKWEKVASPTRLRKTFNFMSQEKRNEFVQGLFEYETKTRHNAMITVDEDKVTLDVRTKDVDQITELDKEYAKFADVLFRDVVYNLSADNEY
jgi:pterin-4a-carbinolamine dehydratase